MAQSQSTQPHFYQAIGTVYGILDLKAPNSTLTVGERVFPVTVKSGVEKRHHPGEVECFRFYPSLKLGQISLHIIAVVPDAPQEKVGGELILKGCWELYQEQPYFIIYRNDLRGIRDCQTRILVPVVWDNAPPTDGQFWQARATIEDGAFTIIHADGPFEPPPKATKFVPPKSSSSAPSTSTKLPTSISPLTQAEIKAMAIPAKVQLACKINQVPPNRTLPDGRAEFFFERWQADFNCEDETENLQKAERTWIY